MHLSQLFQRSVNMHPDRPALALGTDRALTYRELDQRVQALAGWLRQAHGLQPGDRVCLALKNCVHSIEAMLACWSAGLCVVPVNAKLHATEIAFILEDSQSRLCLSHGSLLAQIRAGDPPSGTAFIDVQDSRWDKAASGRDAPALRHACTGATSDLAWLFYTSGTTGRPKGVMLSHANLVAMALNFHADMLPIDADDVLIHAAPLSHGSGLYGIPYLMRGALQVVGVSGGFDEAELVGLLQHYRSASLFAAPTMVTRLVRHLDATAGSVPGLRCLLVGGAPFHAKAIREAIRCLGPRVAQMYGQGETPMTISAVRAQPLAQAVAQDDAALLGSVGFAQTTVEIAILDDAGRPLPAGGVGEIWVRGPTVMSGYWNNPTGTSNALVGGGLLTGDIGIVDERGLLHLKDRSKDVIISGGSNIYPREVEDALLSHPAVTECCVFGIEDDEWGERVAAAVVAGAEVTEASLDALCKQRIAGFKRPRTYYFIDDLPKNPTGKVLKGVLRASLRASAA